MQKIKDAFQMVLGFIVIVYFSIPAIEWLMTDTPEMVFQVRDPVFIALSLFGIWWLMANVIHVTILGCFGFFLTGISIAALFILAPFIPALWLVIPILMIFGKLIYNLIRFGLFFRGINYTTFMYCEQHYCTKLMYEEGFRKVFEDRDNHEFLDRNDKMLRWLGGHSPREYVGAWDYWDVTIDWEGIKKDAMEDGEKVDFMNQMFNLANIQLFDKTFVNSIKPAVMAIGFYIAFSIVTSIIGYVLTMGYTTTEDHGIAYYCEMPKE